MPVGRASEREDAGNEGTGKATHKRHRPRKFGGGCKREKLEEAGIGIADVPGSTGQQTVDESSVQGSALELLNKGWLVERDARRERL